MKILFIFFFLRFLYFWHFYQGVQNRVLLAERQTACFNEEKKKKPFLYCSTDDYCLNIFRYGVVWFLIFTHDYNDDDDGDAFRGHFSDACAILKCVLLFRGYHFICNNKLAGVGGRWTVVENYKSIFFLFSFSFFHRVFPSCFKSKST